MIGTLGFVILAHTDLHRVAELVHHLSANECAVAIHIDKKVSNTDFANFKNDLSGLKNVVLSKRTACEWGEFSLVKATLDASEALLNSFENVSHVSLISGSCLPIRPVRQMKRFLNRNAKTDFIESVSVKNNYWVKDGLNEERFTFYFPFSWRKQRKLFDRTVDLQRLVKIKRVVPEPLVPHIGSQWWTLTAKTLRAIINDPKRPFYDAYFNWSWIPDESYFQTLARLHSTSIESRSLTFSKFDYLGKPFIFYDDHQKELTQSDCFWARKIWSGADRLYSTLLSDKRANQPMSGSNAKAFDEKFEEADLVRCEGGVGRFHQGRFPYDRAKRNGVSETPFTVFVGFDGLYSKFPEWVEKNTECLSYGNIFARKHVAGFPAEHNFAGNLPAEPKVRNRNPKGYLANLFWGNREREHSFTYDLRDNSRILGTLAHDRMATVVLVRHSWLLDVLKKSSSFENLMITSKRFHRLERRFISEFEKKSANAKLVQIGLEDMLEEPAKALQTSVSHIAHAKALGLSVLPNRRSIEGLDHLVRKLRNNGLKIDYDPKSKAKNNKTDDIEFKKPYVVK